MPRFPLGHLISQRYEKWVRYAKFVLWYIIVYFPYSKWNECVFLCGISKGLFCLKVHIVSVCLFLLFVWELVELKTFLSDLYVVFFFFFSLCKVLSGLGVVSDPPAIF